MVEGGNEKRTSFGEMVPDGGGPESAGIKCKDKLDSDINGGTTAGSRNALVGLVRELIRSPGFKELVTIHLREMDPGSARELVRTFLWEDVGFSMGVMGSSPRVVNWVAEALVELGVQLNNFTRDILRDFLVRMGKDLDLEKIKSIPGAYAPLVNDLLLEDREALDALLAALGSLAESVLEAVGPTLKKIGNTADFGKVRVGLTEHFERRRKELHGEPPPFNPVTLSNLLGVAPPLVNYFLRVITRVVQGLNLPAEILANAVFQLLEDVDQEEVGGLVNALSDFIITLHRGNLVLGRDEPRFKDVLRRMSRRLVDNVDGERLKEAVVALGEDGKVIGEIVSEYLYATPESTAQVARVLYVAVNSALRTTAEFLRRFAELPPEDVRRIVSHYREAFHPRELARVVNYNAVILNKAFTVRPDLVKETLEDFLSGLDRKEAADAGKALLRQTAEALLSDPTVSAALEPEALGKRINAALADFNRFLRENPGVVAEKISRTLRAVDTRELKKAASGVLVPLAKSLAKETDIPRKVGRLAAAVAAAVVIWGQVLNRGTPRGISKRRKRGKARTGRRGAGKGVAG